MSLELFADPRVGDFGDANAWHQRLLGRQPSYSRLRPTTLPAGFRISIAPPSVREARGLTYGSADANATFADLISSEWAPGRLA